MGRSDPITGQAIAAFVTLRSGVTGDEALIEELRDTVSGKIGPIAKPQSIVFTDDLPKRGRARSCGGSSKISPSTVNSAT